MIQCVQVITLTEQAELAESYERRVKSLETEMQTATKKLQSEKKKNSAFGEAASKACETLQTKVKSLNQELSERAGSSPISADVADFCARLVASVNSATSAMNPASCIEAS